MRDGMREDAWTILSKLEQALVESGTDAWTDNVSRLFKIHENQWELEDLCHDASAPSLSIGRLKREIDRSNAERVVVVRTLDSLVDLRREESRSQADPIRWPLTLGQAIDQLVITIVRSERADADSIMLERLREHQIAALDSMLTLLLEGRLMVPPASSGKHYRRTWSSEPEAPSNGGPGEAERP